MKRTKQILAVLIAIICTAITIISPLTVMADTPVALVIDGHLMTDLPTSAVIQNDRTLVPARAVFQYGLGAEVEWHGDTGTVLIHFGDTTMMLAIGSTALFINGYLTQMPIPAQIINGSTMIPLGAIVSYLGFESVFVENTVFLNTPTNIVGPFFPDISDTNSTPTPAPTVTPTPAPTVTPTPAPTATPAPPAPSGSRTVIIDPGHGGDRPGAVHNNVRAADLNLAVAAKLIELLENHGITVYTTRTGDYNVSLYERAELANQRGDIMVTIHHNAWHTPYVSGTETFYRPSEHDELRSLTSQNLANIIQEQLIDHTGRNNRGSKVGEFVVLRYSQIPTVLIEVGFMSNPAEFAELITAQYQMRVAQAIFEGLLEAFLIYES